MFLVTLLVVLALALPASGGTYTVVTTPEQDAALDLMATRVPGGGTKQQLIDRLITRGVDRRAVRMIQQQKTEVCTTFRTLSSDAQAGIVKTLGGPPC